MYQTLFRIYQKDNNQELLKQAVKAGWISEEQKQQIIGKE